MALALQLWHKLDVNTKILGTSPNRFPAAVICLIVCMTGCGAPADDGGIAIDLRARNMALVGYHDLQARSACQPVVHACGDRRVLFVGHHAGEALNPLTDRK